MLPEVTLQGGLYRVGLPDVQQQVHEVLENRGNVTKEGSETAMVSL